MSEKEAAELRDYILFLELENTVLALENANLRDQVEANNQPTYD